MSKLEISKVKNDVRVSGMKVATVELNTEEDAEWIAQVLKPEWANRIVTAVNAHSALVEAATFARNRLLQDSGDEESITKLSAALALAEGKE